MNGLTHKPMERDHELLLEPIQTDAPAGRSLRYDPVYDRIKAARHGEDATLSQGVWQREPDHPDWALVEELCYTALQTSSKDLQLAVWLSEAWLHLYGLCGLTSGCQLISDLHHAYLLSMFPTPKLPAPALGDDAPAEDVTLPLDSRDAAIEHRLNMLQWLNEKLSIEVKLLPLTAPSENTGVPAVSLADIEAARYKSHQSRKAAGAAGQTVAVDAGLARSLELTPEDCLAQTWTDLHHALDVVEALGKTLDRYYGEANGGLLQITGVLNEMIVAISPGIPLATRVPAPPPPVAGTVMLGNAAATAAPKNATQTIMLTSVTAGHHPDTEPDTEPDENPDAAAMPYPGIRSREEAYALLGEIAAYLARIEPHSPVPYLLQRAIAWGGMSLHELLPELLSDQIALRDVGHLLRLDANGRTSTK